MSEDRNARVLARVREVLDEELGSTGLIGQVIPGFCNGYFGRDSYEDKTIEAVGRDWIVARDFNGGIHFATFENVDETTVAERVRAWQRGEG